MWILAIFVSGVSSILGAVNFVTTIFRMRAPGMTLFRMPIFVWAVLSAQIIQLFGLPALTAGTNQKANALRRGNAISSAPIIIGTK
ncbi:cbb3-type cytochrome c oxidase subunit I [Anaplasma marginale]|uniref:cbb3-type cytochrome c oxidase subunit I n=1 Tax=Anaplasma marginale TaxID=770 RepID=UPI001F52A4ED|nr:cbb3-type cytochrome c oxidase subunit I [Anaplasma marginale]